MVNIGKYLQIETLHEKVVQSMNLVKQNNTIVQRVVQYFHVEKSSNTLTSMFYLFLLTTFTLKDHSKPAAMRSEMGRLSLQPFYSQCQPTRCI